jgi:hypothetical protein
MRRFPFKNYFEMLCPMLEADEKELIFRHPVYPIYVNQLGILFPDNDYNATLNLDKNTYCLYKDGAKKGTTIGNRGKLIYECFFGKIANGNAILNLNGNIYDYSMYNLILRSDKKAYEIYLENRSRLINNSVNYMLNKDKWLTSKGYNVEKYWEFVNLPAAVLSPYIKHKGMFTDSGKKFSNKELLPTVISMYESGSSQTEIKKALGINNTSSVRFLLKKAKLL